MTLIDEAKHNLTVARRGLAEMHRAAPDSVIGIALAAIGQALVNADACLTRAEQERVGFPALVAAPPSIALEHGQGGRSAIRDVQTTLFALCSVKSVAHTMVPNRCEELGGLRVTLPLDMFREATCTLMSSNRNLSIAQAALETFPDTGEIWAAGASGLAISRNRRAP